MLCYNVPNDNAGGNERYTSILGYWDTRYAHAKCPETGRFAQSLCNPPSGIRTPLHFNPHLRRPRYRRTQHPSDRFPSAWQVGLSASPFIDSRQQRGIDHDGQTYVEHVILLHTLYTMGNLRRKAA